MLNKPLKIIPIPFTLLPKKNPQLGLFSAATVVLPLNTIHKPKMLRKKFNRMPYIFPCQLKRTGP